MTHTSQRFCLRWNNHHSNLLSVFDQLLHKESFVDVTLAVEGQLLKAHKVILSACSPYFETLFVSHPDKHPIVILKDVPFADMRSLLDFIYRGEVSVDQDRLTGFLKVAESLRIKGLTEVNEEKCDLPSIASSLLSSSGQQQQPPAAPSPAAPPPPPPSLHRIHLGQPSPSSCSSPGANAPANKRCVPSPSSFHPFSGNSNSNDNSDDLSNASSCYNQKRKRGRPRKLSASSETPSGASPEHDLDSENRISTLSLSNLSDSSYAHGPPDLLEVNMTEHSQHSPSSFCDDQNIESPLPDDSCHETSEDCCVKTEPNEEPSAVPGASSFAECQSPRMRESPGSRSQSQTPTNTSDRYPPDKCQWKEILKRLKKPEISIQVEKNERQYDDTPFLKCRRNFFLGSGGSSGGNANSNSDSNNGVSKGSAEQEGYSSGDGSKGLVESMEWYMDTHSASQFYGEGDGDDVDDEDEAMIKYEYDSLRASASAADDNSSPAGVGSAIAALASATTASAAAANSSGSSGSLASGGGGNAEPAAKPLDKSSVRRYCVQVAEHLFQCTLCYKTYTHISNFSRHFLSAHHGLRQEIPCPVCYRIFTRRDNMLTHMKQVHRITVTRGLATSLIQKLSAGSGESASPSPAPASASGSGSSPADARVNSGTAS